MKQILMVVCGAILVVMALVGIFTLNQANQEQLELTARLQSRSQVLTESLVESIEPLYNTQATSTVQRVIDRFVSNERLAGLGVFDNTGNPIATSENIPVPEDRRFVTNVMDSDEAMGDFVRKDTETYYTFVAPLHENNRVVGALVVSQNATYIDESIGAIWRGNILRLLALILLFSGAIFVLIRFIFFRSIAQLAESLQQIRKGDGGMELKENVEFLQPLIYEFSKMSKSLRQARYAASEEARMRHEKIDTPWTAERLKEFIKGNLKDRPIYVLSNREPYVHSLSKNNTAEWAIPAGGLVTALEPVMEACGGTWIAHGSGSADKATADENGKLLVPPDEPRYTLKRVWLTPEETQGYYSGFSNEALWPLCLMAHTRPLFRTEDWTEYKKVNAKFAKILLDEIRHVERPIILLQDYHLALAPHIIKRSRPDALVALYWHIPWPSALQFNICPWRKEIIEGILGADLVGFQTQQHCNNFIDTVANEIESRIDYEQFSVFREDHQTHIKPFPISIAYPGNAEARGTVDKTILDNLHIHTPYLVLGVDRLDYTKGILERFKGFEFLLHEHPEYVGKATLLQIASPSRETVEKYREYAEKVTSEAARINKKFGTRDWTPIVLEKRNYTHEKLQHLYRLAHVCLITSLHDGMNLVAKEFAAARVDESGVLILSQFAGASRDLKGALLVNPYSAEETSNALHTALTMPKSEQYRRMKMMRFSVRDYNIYRWSAELIKALLRLE